MTMTCGIDWAERHHDVALMDPAGLVVARRRISDDLEGLRQLQELLGAHTANPTAVRVAIETDRGLLVAALRAAGHTVHVINPRAVARYRERHGQAGGKSDPADAIVLANIPRTDGHLHRALPDDTELAKRVRVLARQHQEAIWARQQTVNRLRTLLHQFFPAALRAFPDLTRRASRPTGFTSHADMAPLVTDCRGPVPPAARVEHDRSTDRQFVPALDACQVTWRTTTGRSAMKRRRSATNLPPWFAPRETC